MICFTAAVAVRFGLYYGKLKFVFGNIIHFTYPLIIYSKLHALEEFFMAAIKIFTPFQYLSSLLLRYVISNSPVEIP